MRLCYSVPDDLLVITPVLFNFLFIVLFLVVCD